MKTIVNNWHNISIGLAIIFAAFAFLNTGDAHQFYLLASASVLCLHFFEEFGYPGGFGMSLMLAATELGIDSIPAYELIKYPYILRDNLPIPEDEDIIMGIALGHESEEHINEYDSPRLDLDEILKIN